MVAVDSCLCDLGQGLKTKGGGGDGAGVAVGGADKLST